MDLTQPDLSHHATVMLPLVEKELAGLMKDIGALHQRRIALETRAETLRKVAGAMRDLLNSPQYAAKPPEPNGQIVLPDVVGRKRTGEQLLLLMKSEPAQARRPGDWLIRLRERGWIDPQMGHQREAVRSALNKLADNKKSGVERVPGTTLYGYIPPKEVTALDKG